MTQISHAPEPDMILPLAHAIKMSDEDSQIVKEIAKTLLTSLRKAQHEGWVNQFLNEYRLGTEEGTALLSLAEAFLRVPDHDTADLLISDKIGNADWGTHSGKSASTLVNSATWGLVLGKAMVGPNEGSVLKTLIARTGEPFVRQGVGAAMRLMGQIFVMGRNIEEAVKRMNKSVNRGFTASFDMLGEAARTEDDATRYFNAYCDAIRKLAKFQSKGKALGHSISVKLSALHPRYEVAHRHKCVPELIEKCLQLAQLAADSNILLTIDAEEAARLDMSLDIIEAVASAPQLAHWDGLGMAIQAYSKRAMAVIGWADEMSGVYGRKLQVRLVKGAYWDSEIKYAQEQGLSGYPLFTRKAATDVSYLACAAAMLDAKNLFPAFATHNALTVASIIHLAGDRRDFEFQRLHGMGDGLFENLVREQGYQCRIYAPVGGHRDLLAYLVRRLLENGANSSFVHQLSDHNMTDDELLKDPVDRIIYIKGARHPSIPLPCDLYQPERLNSRGVHMDDAGTLDALMSRMNQPIDLIAPQQISTDTLSAMIANAQKAFVPWSRMSVDNRAAILEIWADLLEEQRETALQILVKEANKNIFDAINEVREAVDFCRYYAAQAREQMQDIILPGPTGEQNILRMDARGIWAAIAPWNFPLAIFMGQIAAALVTGNGVIAKPAPQTPIIGKFAVDLAYQAGVPKDVLQFANGGADLGKALVEDARINGVVFTGSVPTARHIARSLLIDDNRPLVPLIAETGGLNAMIVDSTALPEQVVRDVIISGFQSAGQRCSALRLLAVQDDIYDNLVEMLCGAMDSLNICMPDRADCDVGPVIDKASYDKLMGYLETQKNNIIKSANVPKNGLFVPPTLIAIDKVSDLQTEWFGPIIHIVKWRRGGMDALIAQINNSGFGLTMGVHSRIARVTQRVEAQARVGNLYVNRSIIGAVVGSQPFGGEGHSGTGPKAGGPHYLSRFCVERTISTDTTSAGGNASLLSLDDDDFEY
ncbi:bifunctional proline dehydrogenase/L-glutamate gamma-semialdehyde dehydrogenase [Sphingorhabdus lutea]|uniref:Bifunctional protein PutA n=2 Tax=Sphingorhabdus lutea TaxID=1913578 RepID=A0A1L3JBA5_9SPHN|nr:bifunctional proline dehydrogenase/L-glutamate gamma-semialdehyde dehydrogenase [Sphingorhabdus lutea]